jgi:hypothetical protein
MLDLVDLDNLLRKHRLHLTLIGHQGAWTCSLCGDDGSTLAGICRATSLDAAVIGALRQLHLTQCVSCGRFEV